MSHPQPTTHLHPSATTLSITEVAALFDVKENTLRQRIRRGTMPEPSALRAPELTWSAHDIYAWAVANDYMPLAAVPFRHLRHVIDTNQLAHQVPRLSRVTNDTQPRGLRGIHVLYSGASTDTPRLTLFYPHYTAAGANPIESEESGIGVSVTGHIALRGCFVNVFQRHPGYTYEDDTADLTTRQVAELLGEAIPYWPHDLRSAPSGIDRRTQKIEVVRGATALPDDEQIDRAVALASFTPPDTLAGARLGKALGERVDEDYRRAAHDAEAIISDSLSRSITTTWGLTDSARHLVLAATPARYPDPAEDDRVDAGERDQLIRTVSVGDTPVTRLVAAGFVDTYGVGSFEVETATSAQTQLLRELDPVAPGEATLAHLGFEHPLRYRSPQADAIPRSYWRHTRTGTVATCFEAVDGVPGYCCYRAPDAYPEVPDIAEFDFEDEREPFVWTASGTVLPYPQDLSAGYALGYHGSGPQQVREATAALLGLAKDAPITVRWPFTSPGYPTRVSLADMRALYEETAS